MTEHRRPTRLGALHPLAWPALLLIGALLQGCGQGGTGAGRSRLRMFAADFAGAAKTCEVPTVTPTSGQSVDATMTLANDGGWCGVPVHQDGPRPYDAGLLTARPAHGTVLIHGVGDFTRIDYTPDRGYSGADSFSVRLVPGNAIVRIAVTVTARGK
jgi:hypothetical protein